MEVLHYNALNMVVQLKYAIRDFKVELHACMKSIVNGLCVQCCLHYTHCS